MASPPVPHTWTAGTDNATSANLQTLTDAALWLLGSTTSTGTRKPLFRGRNAAGMTFATSGTPAAVTLEVEDVDYDNGHSTVTNTSRYTAQTAGWHLASGQISYPANATGQRVTYLAVNGTARAGTRIEVQASAANSTEIATPTDLVYLNVGDYLEVFGLQNSAGSLTATSAAMNVAWISN